MIGMADNSIAHEIELIKYGFVTLSSVVREKVVDCHDKLGATQPTKL